MGGMIRRQFREDRIVRVLIMVEMREVQSLVLHLRLRDRSNRKVLAMHTKLLRTLMDVLLKRVCHGRQMSGCIRRWGIRKGIPKSYMHEHINASVDVMDSIGKAFRVDDLDCPCGIDGERADEEAGGGGGVCDAVRGVRGDDAVYDGVERGVVAVDDAREAAEALHDVERAAGGEEGRETGVRKRVREGGGRGEGRHCGGVAMGLGERGGVE